MKLLFILLFTFSALAQIDESDYVSPKDAHLENIIEESKKIVDIMNEKRLFIEAEARWVIAPIGLAAIGSGTGHLMIKASESWKHILNRFKETLNYDPEGALRRLEYLHANRKNPNGVRRFARKLHQDQNELRARRRINGRIYGGSAVGTIAPLLGIVYLYDLFMNKGDIKMADELFSFEHSDKPLVTQFSKASLLKAAEKDLAMKAQLEAEYITLHYIATNYDIKLDDTRKKVKEITSGI